MAVANEGTSGIGCSYALSVMPVCHGWMAWRPKAKLFRAYIAPFVQVDAAGLVFPEASLDITGGNNLQVKAEIHQYRRLRL